MIFIYYLISVENKENEEMVKQIQSRQLNYKMAALIPTKSTRQKAMAIFTRYYYLSQKSMYKLSALNLFWPVGPVAYGIL